MHASIAPILDSQRALDAWWTGISPQFAPGGYRAGWWPARSPLEIMVTAILVQNTRWENAARAAELLRAAGLLPADDSIAAQAACTRAMHALQPAGLEPLLRPAGCASIKSRRLWYLLDFLLQGVGADLGRLDEIPTRVLRRQLLGVHGIGPETADAILLYALDRPAFPVDAYLRRVFARHGWSGGRAAYGTLSLRVRKALSDDVPRLHRYHAHIVELAKRHCGRRANCDACPLRHLLPG